jgi:hypothetical protein
LMTFRNSSTSMVVPPLPHGAILATFPKKPTAVLSIRWPGGLLRLDRALKNRAARPG